MTRRTRQRHTMSISMNTLTRLNAKLVTQRMIDAFHLTGPSEEIRQQIQELGNMGVTTISTVLFTIFDKIGMMRKFSEEIMPHFRN